MVEVGLAQIDGFTQFAGHIMAALHGYQAEWNE